MLKNVPIMPVFFMGLTVFSSVSTAPWLPRFPQRGLATILRFRAKSDSLVLRPSLAPVFDRLQYAKTESEGLGDFSLLNNETTQTSTSWLGSWESCCLLPERLTATNTRSAITRFYSAARTCSRWLHLTSTTCVLFPWNCPIIPKLRSMLLRTDYSRNYAGILDASLTAFGFFCKVNANSCTVSTE